MENNCQFAIESMSMSIYLHALSTMLVFVKHVISLATENNYFVYCIYLLARGSNLYIEVDHDITE